MEASCASVHARAQARTPRRRRFEDIPTAAEEVARNAIDKKFMPRATRSSCRRAVNAKLVDCVALPRSEDPCHASTQTMTKDERHVARKILCKQSSDLA